MNIVYLLFDEHGLPFYVGTTTNIKRRKGEWLRELHIQQHAYVLLGEDLSKETALALEAHFIKLLGRRVDGDGGLLVNQSLFHKNTGRVYSEETHAKLRMAVLGKHLSEAHRSAISAAQTGKTHTADTKARLSAIASARVNPAYIERLREQAKRPRIKRKS